MIVKLEYNIKIYKIPLYLNEVVFNNNIEIIFTIY